MFAIGGGRSAGERGGTFACAGGVTPVPLKRPDRSVSEERDGSAASGDCWPTCRGIKSKGSGVARPAVVTGLRLGAVGSDTGEAGSAAVGRVTDGNKVAASRSSKPLSAA